MAAQGPTTTATTPAVTTSRLTQMQMRFQQRQQQERDQRKVEMVSSTKTVTTSGTTTSSSGGSSSTIRSSATAIHSVTTSSNSAAIQQDLSASLGAGKVRQMFDERRHHKAAGIDKSYPLQPIGQVVKNGGASNGSGNTVSPPSKMAAATANGMNNKTRVPPISANTKARLARQQQENGNGEALSKSGGGATFDDNENLLEDEKFPDTISFDEDLTLTSTGTPLARKLPNVGKLTTTPSSNGTTPPQNVNSLKLKPVPGRTPTTTSLKAAAPKKPTPAVVPSTNPSSSPRGSQPSSAKSRASTGKSGTGMAASATIPGSRKASAASIASGSIASGITNDSGPVPDGMARCSVCGRNFAEDRVAKHMEICRKTKSKKRKVFDVTKHRVQGTDAEKYVLRKGKAGASSSKKSISGPAAATATAASGGKGDWRRKHEEFIAAIRAAKEMKAYLAKGGKLSDLPPPPPSENPDYIQCPHCSRRFNQTAAERHIPKCATMLHNKPKPAAKGRRV